jgi:hypothetical protein
MASGWVGRLLREFNDRVHEFQVEWDCLLVAEGDNVPTDPAYPTGFGNARGFASDCIHRRPFAFRAGAPWLCEAVVDYIQHGETLIKAAEAQLDVGLMGDVQSNRL